jgi:hypothetical protein
VSDSSYRILSRPISKLLNFTETEDIKEEKEELRMKRRRRRRHFVKRRKRRKRRSIHQPEIIKSYFKVHESSFRAIHKSKNLQKGIHWS